jgi:hypothetical protein
MRHTPSRLATTLITGAALATLATACSSAGVTSPAAPTTATPATGTATPRVNTVPGVSTVDTSPTGATTTQPGAVNPNAPEVVAPGDIPDNQAFVAFASSGGTYTVKVPEGWARTEASGVVTFTDKYNSIAIQSTPAASPPTVISVKSTGLTDVASDPTYKLTGVSTVTRKAGAGVLATYEIGSIANQVTGKKALLAVERYEFFHNGTTVTLTLSGAKGADNVDPWKIVSDSLSWK